ncbi:MAG: SUMF1/EgtB/PvdO family nonheme iron enzyme [Planctomycetota bacterium]|nr:SUMF1/EgtB/PvdO family nonheme iron enzyme [Planctomycetota bacterium]
MRHATTTLRRFRFPTAGHSLFQKPLIAMYLAGIAAGCGGTPTPDDTSVSAPASHVVREVEPVINSVGMELVLIPAGSFQMGTADGATDVRADETPRRKVTITKPFYLGRYEVTQAEYTKIFPTRKSFFCWPDGGGKDRVQQMKTARFPAELVKWVDAVEFCQRLTAQPTEQAAGRTYRLPTEAEWEYACRAGTESAFHFGDSLSSTDANFIGTEPFGNAAPGPFLNRTTTVGSYQPNAFGLYDMHGNVWEWCSDWYDRDYYRNAPASDPPGPQAGSRKVIRGGDWYSDGRDCRTAFRYAGLPRGTFYATGMRVVMEYGTSRYQSASLPQPGPAKIKTKLADAGSTNEPEGGTDWPRWRGSQGNGQWVGAALPDPWPTNGLRRVWRQPLGGGYGGVSVADGRVYVMDRQLASRATERVVCFDAATGHLLWKEEYPSDYGEMAYANGPRTTPTVTDGVVYTLGAAGQVLALDAQRGRRIWARDLLTEDKAPLPVWGFCSSPITWEHLLIIQAGAPQGRCLLALDRLTGKTVWTSLNDAAGYSTPLVVEHDGSHQIICWTPTHVRSVTASTGDPLWSVPFEADSGMAIAMPSYHRDLLLVTGYYNGTMALRLETAAQTPTAVWENRRELRGHMAQPLCRDGYGYVLDRRHGVTCFELTTGRKLWDAENRVTAKARNPHATMVWVGDSDKALVLNSDGELILASLIPQGYREHARAKLLGETWAHPAYSGHHIYARSDTEIVCFSMRVP